jgi:hypothetical protein
MSAQPTSRPAPLYQKEIIYDRETRDYAMYLDGELVGFARTYQEAEATLDQLVFELLSGGQPASLYEQLDEGLRPTETERAADADAVAEARGWANDAAYAAYNVAEFGN